MEGTNRCRNNAEECSVNMPLNWLKQRKRNIHFFVTINFKTNRIVQNYLSADKECIIIKGVYYKVLNFEWKKIQTNSFNYYKFGFIRKRRIVHFNFYKNFDI